MRRSFVGFCVNLFFILMACCAVSAHADYPLPAQAGFHHCALIYNKDARGVKELRPLVVRSENGKAKEWLFDAFLFLVYTTPRAIDTLSGATIRSDWQYQLDRWFAPNRDLAALDATIEQAQADLGAPPRNREVMLAIPYLNPGVKNFGDVEGNGHSADLSTPDGRASVLRWYIREARQRFRAAGYKHLHLWGFYWMREEMPAGDESTVRQAALEVHAGGDKLLWIPYFQAAGWNRWHGAGIDVAMMQSVYAFTFAHHGDIRRNRLAVTATGSRRYGLGAEIECSGDIVKDPKDRYYFRCYLADGAPTRLGYQQAATAYYLGDDLVEQMLASPLPEIRSLYDALADYVTGRTVPDPDPPTRWRSPQTATLTNDLLSAGRPVAAAETRFPAPRTVSHVDLFLEEDANDPWTGTAQVEVLLPGAANWSPGGWAVRTASDVASGVWQAFTVPLGQTVVGLRVTCRPLEGRQLPPLRAIAPEYGEGEKTHFHLAQFKPYRFVSSLPAAYPDEGRKLVDGVIPDKNFLAGKSVGWLWTDAAIHFDLGRVRNVSTLEVYCQGGGGGAVNWPAFACAALSTQDMPPAMQTARGPLPPNTRWLLPLPLEIDQVRKPDDKNGHLTFLLERPTPTRYVTLSLKANAWLMLTEIRIFADGVNVAPASKYTLSPPPTPNTDPKAWADDGHRLTDGVIASRGETGQISGWDTGDWREVVMDLVSAQPIHAVTVWGLGGGQAGIYAPVEASAEVSSDGQTWAAVGTAPRPSLNEDGKGLQPVSYRIGMKAETTARYLRVRVRRAQGWAMLSEIVVE
jgi:hypothetical protein